MYLTSPDKYVLIKTTYSHVLFTNQYITGYINKQAKCQLALFLSLKYNFHEDCTRHIY